MKKSQSIVKVALASAALFAIAFISSPVQAQRSGNRPDMNRQTPNHNAANRNQGQHQSNSRDRTPATRPTSQPSHTAHDNRGHSQHGNYNRNSSHRSGHSGVINVDFGRRVPHTTQHRVWVPGHYHTTTQSVLVSAGHYDTVRIPARYEDRYHNGHIDHVMVEPERVTNVWHPAEYENRSVQTWVPGYYKVVTDTHYHTTRPSISIGGIFRF